MTVTITKRQYDHSDLYKEIAHEMQLTYATVFARQGKKLLSDPAAIGNALSLCILWNYFGMERRQL